MPAVLLAMKGAMHALDAEKVHKSTQKALAVYVWCRKSCSICTPMQFCVVGARVSLCHLSWATARPVPDSTREQQHCRGGRWREVDGGVRWCIPHVTLLEASVSEVGVIRKLLQVGCSALLEGL